MEDSELKSLILKAQSGDPDIFRVLYKILSPRVFRFIRPRARNRTEALDALQDTFIDFWKGLPRFSFEGEKALDAFLYRIAVRKLSRGFRFWQSYTELEDVEDIVVDDVSTPTGDVYDVGKMLSSLKSEDRNLITLRDIEDKSFREISELLGEREGALRVRHHRAINRLKKKFNYE